MSVLDGVETFAETIVQFRSAGDPPGPGPVPPGPVPPGPVPPGPTPGPTPTPGGGGGSSWWVSQTGDALSIALIALFAIAAIVFGFVVYKKYKQSRGSYGNYLNTQGFSSIVSSAISNSVIAKVCIFLLSACIAIFTFTGVANAAINVASEQASLSTGLVDTAYADDPAPETRTGIDLSSKGVIYVDVYTDGTYKIVPCVENTSIVDVITNVDKEQKSGTFYSLEVSSDQSLISNVNWKFTSENTVLFNQVANKPNATNISLPLPYGESYSISLELSNLDATTALSLVGKNVASIKYMADANVMDSPDEDATHGVLQDAFEKDGHDATFASSVEFVKSKAPAEGTYRSKADVSRSGSGAIIAYMVDDVDESGNKTGGYHIVVNSDDYILCAPNTCSRLFQNFRNLNYVDFGNLDTSTCTDFSYMFENCGRDDGEASMLDFSMPFNHEGKFQTGENASLAAMFYGCDCSIDATNIDTSKVVSMNSLFENYADNVIDSARANYELKLADGENKFVIPKDCTVDYMFRGCNYDITYGPKGPGEDAHNLLTDLDTSASEHFARMFAGYEYVPPVAEPTNDDSYPTLDVSVLNVSKAKDMSQMFMYTYGMKALKDPKLTIKFGTKAGDFSPGASAEVNMYGFFEFCNIVNLDLSPIDFSKVTSMDSMFAHYGFLNVTIEKLGMKYQKLNVTWPKSTGTSAYPAQGCKVDYMYCSTSIEPSVLASWDGTKVTSAVGMFLEYGWNSRYNLIPEQLTISFPENYKFGDYCVCEYMFHQAKADVDLTNWDASNIVNFKGMFLSYGAREVKEPYKITFGTSDDWFKPAAGASFEGMFEMVQLDTVDLSFVDLNQVSDFSYMFEGFGQNISLSKQILNPFAGSIVWPKYEDKVSGKPLPITPAKPTATGQEGANMSYMFLNYRLCGADFGNNIDLSNWDTSNVRNFQGIFSGVNGYSFLGGGCHGANLIVPEGGLKTGTKANISYMFQNSKVYTALTPKIEEPSNFMYENPSLKLTDIIQTKDVENFSHVFDGAYSGDIGRRDGESGPFWYESVTIDVSDIDYTNATDMSYMFANAFSKMNFGGKLGSSPVLTGKVILFQKITGFTKTINGEHFFDGCNVELIDLKNFDTGLFNNLSYFFANYGYRDCLGTIYNLDNFNMSNATAVAGLFYNSFFKMEDDKPLELDWTKFDVSKITDMSYMFYGFKPKKLNISTWNPESCTNMEGMFMDFGADSMDKTDKRFGYETTLVLPSTAGTWKTGSECNMKWMFALCCADVDLSGFDVSKVTNMEGMFMAYGTSSQELGVTIRQVVNNIIRIIREKLGPIIPINPVKEEEIVELLNGNWDTVIDAAVSYALKDYRSNLDEGISGLDNITGAYKSLTEVSSTAVKEGQLSNSYYDNGVDQVSLDSYLADAMNNDLISGEMLDASSYKNTYLSALDSTSKYYVGQLKDIFSDVLASSGFKDFIEVANISFDKDTYLNGTPNINNKPFKLTLPNAFKPASDTSFGGNKRCSMKAMFALFNFSNLELEKDKKYSDYMVELSKIDTEFVCDMGFMFTAYMFHPVAEPAASAQYQIPSIDVSGFNTSNIGVYDPTSNDAEQPVGSMMMMFALTGSKINSGTQESKDISYTTEYKFGENFVIPQKCDTRLMFAYASGKKADMTKVNVTTTMSFAAMFTLCNICDLDLSTWGKAMSPVTTQYMFAGYGLLGGLIDEVEKFNMIIGNSESKFKLYYPVDPLGAVSEDTNTEGMFIFPLLNSIDLKNVDVSKRKSLSKMFEFCIMPLSLAGTQQSASSAAALDISTWNTENINDYSLMFAFTLISGMKIPTFKTAATGAVADYMFCFAHAYDIDASTKAIKGLDFSSSELGNLISAKGMFLGYNLALPANLTKDASLKFGSNTFTKLSDASWMFAFTSTNIDLSGIKMTNIKKADFMFAFAGLYPFSRIQSAVKKEDGVLSYYSSIKLPESSTDPAFKFQTDATTNYMFLMTFAGNPDEFDDKHMTNTPQTINLDFLDTQNVVSMKGMFMLSCPSYELEKFNTTKTKSTMLMFAGYGLLPVINLATNSKGVETTDLPVLTFAEKDNSNFKLIGDCDTRYMFSCFVELPSVDRTGHFQNFDVSGIDVSALTNFDSMFAFGLGIFNFDLSTWDISKAKKLDKMFMGYGLLARLSLDMNSPLVPASGKQIKLPAALPTAPSSESEGYCSASWMFAFSCMLDASDSTIGGDIKSTVFDLSGWDFSGIQKADHMFFAYNFTTKAYDQAFSNIGDLFENVWWQYEHLIQNYDGPLSAPLMKASNETVDPRKLVEIKFSTSSPTKFADNAVLNAAFAFADCNVNAPNLDLSNAISCESMFAAYCPSYTVYVDESKQHEEHPEKNSAVLDPNAFKLTLPADLKFGQGCSVKQMFMLYYPHELKVASYNVSGVKDMTRMFAFCRADEINLGTWDTSSCESMEGMFLASCAKEIDMSSWNYNKVKNMRFMFMAYSNKDISTMIYFPENNSMQAARGCDGTGMFALCDSRALMLYGLNVDGFSSVDYMFTGCLNLERIHVSGETDWSRLGGLAGSYMFLGCVKLSGQENTNYLNYHTNIEFARVDNPEANAPGYFTSVATLMEPDPADTNAEVKSIFIKAGFDEDEDLANVKKVVFQRTEPSTSATAKSIGNVEGMITAEIDTTGGQNVMYIKCESVVFSRLSSCLHLFQNFRSLETIEFNNNFDPIAARTMQGMFDGCTSMTNLDLSGLRTGNVEDFSYMFENFGTDECELIFYADSILFDTNSAITFEGMFEKCKVSNLDIRNFVYYHANNLSYMFKDSSVAKINFNDEGSYYYDNRHIEADYSSMFEGCINITCLQLGGFIPSGNSKLDKMFKDCTNLRKIYLKQNFRDNWSIQTTTRPLPNDTFEGCKELRNDENHGIDGEGGLGTSAAFAHETDYSSKPVDEGLFSYYAFLGEYDDKVKEEGLIRSRAGEVECEKAEKLLIAPSDKPDRKYVIDEFDVSDGNLDTVKAYKMSYVKASEWKDGLPYYVVIYSDRTIFMKKNSFRYLACGFDKLTTVEFGTGLSRFSDIDQMDLTCMFKGCTNLATFESTYGGGSKAIFYNPTSTKSMFENCTSLTYFDMSYFRFENGSEASPYKPSFESMFSGCLRLETISSSGDTNLCSLFTTSEEGQQFSEYMFKGCVNLKANGTYDYSTCCKELNINPDTQGPDVRAARAHEDGNQGLFSAGALLPNSSDGGCGIIEESIGRFLDGQVDKYKQLVNATLRIESVEFFKCLADTDYYRDQIQKNLLTANPIDMNFAGEGSGQVKLYLYATEPMEELESYTGKIGAIISIPSSDRDKLMYASSLSFINLCRNFTSLKYFSLEPGENVHCKSDKPIAVTDMINTQAATSCKCMFENTFTYEYHMEYIEHEEKLNDIKQDGIYLDKFDTSNVSNFESMFKGCEARYINFSDKNPNVKQVFNPLAGFFGDDPVTPSNLFSFKSATNMIGMFEKAGNVDFKTSLKSLSLSLRMDSVVMFPEQIDGPVNACDASNMFRYSHFASVDFGGLKLSGVTNFTNMFAFSGAINIEINNHPDPERFNTVNNFCQAFVSSDDAKIQELISAMAELNINLLSYEESQSNGINLGTNYHFNTTDNWGPTLDGYPISMDNMFLCCLTSIMDLSMLNTGKVTSMSHMFAFMPLAKDIKVSKVFETANVKNMNGMFKFFGRITGDTKFGIPNAATSSYDTPAFQIKDGCVMAEMYSNALVPVDASSWTCVDGEEGQSGLNNCRDYTDMFYNFAYYALPPIKLPSQESSEPIGHPENLTITLPKGGWTPKIGTYMNEMFRGCKSNVDLSGITSFEGVTDMSRMFMSYGNGDVTFLGYKQVGITLSSTEDWMIKPGPNSTMAGMFEGYKGLEFKEDESDTRASFQEIVNKLNTSNVVDMSEMFCGAKVTAIDLSKNINFDTSKVRNMYYMFGSKLLRESYLAQLTFGDNFKIDSVVDMRYMFGSIGDYQAALHTIYYDGKNGGDWAKILDPKVKAGKVFTDHMFYACVNIVGGRGTDAKTLYNVDNVDHSFARPATIDKETGAITPGYFTFVNAEYTYTAKKDDVVELELKENNITEDNIAKDTEETQEKNKENIKIDEELAEDEIIEFEGPLDKIDLVIDESDQGKMETVATTFFQNIFNQLFKMILSLAL